MYILFDIGGTKMRLARTKDKKTFDEPVIVETPHTYEEGITLFTKTAKELAEGEKIEGISGNCGSL